MKTILAYLTFAALLMLCYIEKNSAEAAKSQARGRVVRDYGHISGAGTVGQRGTVAQLRQ